MIFPHQWWKTPYAGLFFSTPRPETRPFCTCLKPNNTFISAAQQLHFAGFENALQIYAFFLLLQILNKNERFGVRQLFFVAA